MLALTCPSCQAPLTATEKNLRCTAGHSFDAARQGYWNLLLANQKRSKDPGDNAEMVKARTDFLALGYYQQLSDHLNQLVGKTLSAAECPQIMDMGCGEGYYTNRLHEYLLNERVNTAENPLQLAGLDISKHAVKAACRRNKAVTWLVASGANMPVAEASLDLLTVAFSRLMPEEFARTLKAGAHLIIAYPGDQHLRQLRELIYKEVRESGFDPSSVLGEAFEAISEQQVKYDFELTSQAEIQQLLAMTPHGWRIKQDVRDDLKQLPSLQLTLDVRLAVFRRSDAI